MQRHSSELSIPTTILQEEDSTEIARMNITNMHTAGNLEDTTNQKKKENTMSVNQRNPNLKAEVTYQPHHLDRHNKKKMPFEGVDMFAKDIFLIKKLRMTNEFDGAEKELIEKAIKHLNHIY